METYPDASEWGPILWSILHGLAERSGRPVTPMYAEDERRAWIPLFQLTSDIIPCHICKEHFKAYLKEHPVEELKRIPLHELHEWLRDWFYTVHEWVNMTLEKPSFPKEGLTAAYGTLSIRQRLKQLEVPMSRAIMLSGNNMKKFSEWKQKVQLILSILGL